MRTMFLRGPLALSGLLALVTAAAAPAQNLLVPGLWRPGPLNPGLANILADNATELTFNPACQATTPCSPRPFTGVFQDVTVTTPGLYHLEFLGEGGGTGGFAFAIAVNNQEIWSGSHEGHLVFSEGVQLAAGRNRIEFRSSTTTFRFPDTWTFRPPVLKPAVGPVVSMRGLPDGAGPDLKVSSAANLMAISLGVLPTPIVFPGVRHGLELDPTTMMLLGVSGNPGLSFDLGKEIGRYALIWPRFYVQAATFPAFGPAVATLRI